MYRTVKIPGYKFYILNDCCALKRTEQSDYFYTSEVCQKCTDFRMDNNLKYQIGDFNAIKTYWIISIPVTSSMIVTKKEIKQLRLKDKLKTIFNQQLEE